MAECEQRLSQQEARWLHQGANWRDEMHALRQRVSEADAHAAELAHGQATLRAEAEAERVRMRARLAMAEQAGGARAAALQAEVDRLLAAPTRPNPAARATAPALPQFTATLHSPSAPGQLSPPTRAVAGAGAPCCSAASPLTSSVAVAHAHARSPLAPAAASAHHGAYHVAPPGASPPPPRPLLALAGAAAAGQYAHGHAAPAVDARATLAQLLDEDGW